MSFHSSCSVIPLEILKRGKDAIKVYMEALHSKLGNTKIPRIIALMLGEARMGKTSLYKLLTGLKFDPNQESTHGIDNQTVCTVERRCVGMEQELKEVPPEYQLNEQLATHVVARLGTVTEQKISGLITEEELHRRINDLTMTPSPSPGVEAQSSRLQTSGQLEITTPESKPSRLVEPFKEETLGEPELTGPEQPFQDNTMGEQTFQGVTEPEEPFQIPTKQQQPLGIDSAVSNLISYKLNHPNPGFGPTVYLNMYDFAGQRAYVPMHHCFIVRRAIYLVVFNLQLLPQPIKGNLRDSDLFKGILYWLNSISVYLPVTDDKHMKRVYLVGTHSAAITKEQLLDIDSELRNEFDRIDSCKRHIRYVDCSFSNEREEAIFSPVENSMDGKENWEASGAKALHEELMKICYSEEHRLPFLNEDYPVVWLDFEKKLISERKKRTNMSMIVKWEIVEELAQSCRFTNEKQLQTAVQFFHDTGTLICLRKLYMHCSVARLYNFAVFRQL